MTHEREDYSSRDKGLDYVQRFFGGPPLAVIGRLVLLSILVGVILAALGLDPWNIIEFGAAPRPAYLEHGLRRGALALAVFPARCRDRGADLAPGASGPGAARTLTFRLAFGYVSHARNRSGARDTAT